MGTRIGGYWLTAALTAACWLAPAGIAAAGKTTVAADMIGPLRRPGLGLEAGFHLSDPNRQGDPYVVFGIEMYFNLD